jgi:hypothetical protein
MTATEAEHVALYATEDQIARLVLGKGKDIIPPAISAGPDDDLWDLNEPGPLRRPTGPPARSVPRRSGDVHRHFAQQV